MKFVFFGGGRPMFKEFLLLVSANVFCLNQNLPATGGLVIRVPPEEALGRENDNWSSSVSVKVGVQGVSVTRVAGLGNPSNGGEK